MQKLSKEQIVSVSGGDKDSFKEWCRNFKHKFDALNLYTSEDSWQINLDYWYRDVLVLALDRRRIPEINKPNKYNLI